MQEPLPAELFLSSHAEFDKSHHLFFKGSITLSRAVHPFRKTWLPFYRELSAQITKQIVAITAKKSLRRFDFIVATVECVEYDGEPYVERTESEIFPPSYRVSTEYRGRLVKLHKDGYAYGKLLVDDKTCVRDPAELWIRWKSNLPDYEYIEPDDELDLTERDITFEICTEILDEIRAEIPENLVMRFYESSAQQGDCNKWIEMIKYEIPRVKKKNRITAADEFPVDFAPDCDYPDTSFTIYLRNPCSDEQEKQIEAAFQEFMTDYNINHVNNIHDFMNLKEIADFPGRIDDEKVVQIGVDFGNCNPKVIEKLIKWLRCCGFGIEKINVW